MLNAEMASSTQPHLNDWFKMFTKIDDDGSGRIQFPEFEEMIRKMLELPKDAISDEQLATVWFALDDDGPGFITERVWSLHEVGHGRPGADVAGAPPGGQGRPGQVVKTISASA